MSRITSVELGWEDCQTEIAPTTYFFLKNDESAVSWLG